MFESDRNHCVYNISYLFKLRNSTCSETLASQSTQSDSTAFIDSQA